LNNSVQYVNTVQRTLEGLNLSLNFHFWKVLLAGNTTLSTNYNQALVNNPNFTFDGGIYFIDTLFNSNLDLKAGFNFKYYSAQNYFSYDFEKYSSAQYIKQSSGGDFLPIQKTLNAFRIDFFLAGRIQTAAILYFTWENLLNSQYFLVPYYPALGRSIRIGISWEFLD
jgi:outer membrane receptor protein involved in Fe transport